MEISNKGRMHHKFCIIDNKVITGSYNWTYHGNINKENIVIIEEPDIANNYCEQFKAIFSIGDTITLPYKHLDWTNVKYEVFSEFHKNILLDIEAQNNSNKELIQNKLRNLNVAIKSGNAEELAKASSLSITEPTKTIKDVLTSRSHDFELKLWKEKRYDPNETCNPNDERHVRLEKWKFLPLKFNNRDNSRESIEGKLVHYENGEYFPFEKKWQPITIYDEQFIKTVKRFKKAPEEILCIENVVSFFYKFPSPMYNKTLQRETPRLIVGIELFAIVKEFSNDDIIYNEGQDFIVLKNADNITFHDGWNPYERGKLIKEIFFRET